MAELGVAVAGYAVGGAMTYGTAAYGIGTAVGWAIGSYVGSTMFAEKNKRSYDGPRLDDLRVQTSAHGAPIPEVFGTARISGNLIWTGGIVEHINTYSYDTAGGKGGGGGGGGTETSTWYTYTASFAILLCEGEISGIGRIWMDAKIYLDLRKDIWDAFSEAGSVTNYLTIAGRASEYTLYKGTTTQNPDPTIEGIMGAGQVPGYRGVAYIVFEDMQLTPFLNHIPNMTVEIFKSATATQQQDAINFRLAELEDAPIGNSKWNFSDYAICPITGNLVTAERYNTFLTNPIYTEYTRIKVRDKISNNIIAQFKQPRGIPEYWHLGGMDIADTKYGPCLVTCWNEASTGTSSVTTSPKVIICWHYGLTRKTWSQTPIAPLGLWGSIVNFCCNRDYVVIQYYRYSIGYKYYFLIYEIDYRNTTNYPVWLEDRIEYSSFAGVSCHDIGNIFFNTDTGNLWTRYAVYGSIPRTIREHRGVTPVAIRNILESSNPRMHYTQFQPFFFNYTNSTYMWTALCHNYSDVPGWDADQYYIEQYDENFSTYYIDYTKYDSDDWIKLSTIIAKFCIDSGLTAGQFDVTELANIDVIGYLRARRVSARSLIEPLQMMYLFDIVEKDKKIIFKLRGSASTKTIELTDLAAREEDDDKINRLQTLYANEEELPTVIDLKFVDFSRDYESGSQRYEFKSTPARNHFTVHMPIVMTNTMALQTAQKLLTVARAANKRYNFAVTSKHIDLVPTDIVTIDSARMRIIECKYENGIMYFTAASEWDASDYVSALTTQENEFDPQLPSNVASSFSIFLDTPPLRIKENHPGFYGSIWASEYEGSSWNGATIYRSTDGGGVWNAIITFNTSIISGVTTTLLPEASHTVWDHGNTLTVSLYSGTLSSTTEQGVLNGANLCLHGVDSSWELMQFVTATLNGDGTYTLSDLIRGRLGTHIHMANNALYTNKFILIEETTMFDIINSEAQINIPLLYRTVSIGSSIQTTAFNQYINTCLRLKPFAVTNVETSPDFSGTFIISWIRSDRFIRDTEWNDYASSLKNSEDSEQFQIDILDGETVLNTYEIDDAWEFVYTGTMQTADFGSVQLDQSIDFKIYQMSAIVGRGLEYSGSGINYDSKFDYGQFYDYFTGDDDDPVDSSKWNTVSGTPTIQNNQLELEKPLGGTTDYISSKFRVTGNFDIQIDYNVIEGIDTEATKGSWFEVKSGNNYHKIGVGWGPGQSNANIIQTSYTRSTTYHTYYSSGKFRILRFNTDDFRFYYWNGSSWVFAKQWDNDVSGSMQIRIYNAYATVDRKIVVNYDNFKITAGSAYWV